MLTYITNTSTDSGISVPFCAVFGTGVVPNSDPCQIITDPPSPLVLVGLGLGIRIGQSYSDFNKRGDNSAGGRKWAQHRLQGRQQLDITFGWHTAYLHLCELPKQHMKGLDRQLCGFVHKTHVCWKTGGSLENVRVSVISNSIVAYILLSLVLINSNP